MIKFTEQLEQEEIDDALDHQIVSFLLDLDYDSMPENLQDQYNEIMHGLFGDEEDMEIGMDPEIMEDCGKPHTKRKMIEDEEEEDEDELEEAKKLVRTSPAVKAKRKRLYRKNKARIKLAAKKRSKTASFKRTKAKAKRMAKLGKTSTGKKQTRRK